MITSIRLQHFRSYTDESFEFDPSVNIVVGPNASGKTNLLESVYVLCSGGSYRAKDIDLVQNGFDWCRTEAQFGNQKRILKIKLNEIKADKEFEIESRKYSRFNLERSLPVVLFDPNHMQLISRGPQYRREYFDTLLDRSLASYKKLLGSYTRTLSQRNSLLKLGQKAGAKQLFAWNIRLSELGSQIAKCRFDLIKDINKKISKNYSHISQQKSKVEIIYEAQFDIDIYASKMLSKLEADTSLDYLRGFTARGPHREDFAFILNSKPAPQSASRGETRSLILSLKIFELGLIEKARGTPAIILLDDVFSELDGLRRQRLVDIVGDHQAIITTTDADAALEYFSDSKIIAVPG